MKPPDITNTDEKRELLRLEKIKKIELGKQVIETFLEAFIADLEYVEDVNNDSAGHTENILNQVMMDLADKGIDLPDDSPFTNEQTNRNSVDDRVINPNMAPSMAATIMRLLIHYKVVQSE
jgi:hypothetical protein